MAVLHDAVGPAGGVAQAAAGVTSISWTHTCSGADRVLYVGVSIGGADTTITVTYNGVAMTQVAVVVTGSGTSGRGRLFRLVAPATGAHTVVVTAGAPRDLIGGSTSFTGAHQSSFATPVTATSVTDSVTANVTGTAAGSMVVDHVACGGSIGAFGQTQRYLRNLNSNTGGGNGAGSTAAGGGTVAMGYSRTGAEWWGIIAVEVLAVDEAAVQVVRPVSTLHAGLWTPSGAATLHEATDDETASFADHARSEEAPVDSPAIERLGILRQPAGVVADGDVHLHFQYDKEGVGAVALSMELRQGSTSEASPGTLIATLTDENVADASEGAAVVLTAAQHSNIVYVEGQAPNLYARYVADTGLFVAGGATSGTAVNLQSVINTETADDLFILGDGWFQATSITRAGVTVQAQSSQQAQFTGAVTLNADNISVHGLYRDAAGGSATITVNNPGCVVSDCYVTNFGTSGGYATGVSVAEAALDPANPITITGNLIENWGSNTASWFGAGISIGLQDGTDASHLAPFSAPNGRGVIISHNTVQSGPTTNLPYAACIQTFHPAEIAYNRCRDIHNATIQVKGGNCWIHHNWCSNVSGGDGALYNRAWSDNNLWEYNLVVGTPVGVDHFQGDDCTYRHNVFAGCGNWLRVKEDNDDGAAGPGPNAGTDNLTLLRNTVYNVTNSPAWFWDTSGPGAISDVACDNNVFHTLAGAIVSTTTPPYNAVAGAGNVFHSVGSVQSNIGGATADPQLADPAGGDYEVTNATYADGAPAAAGAAWPFTVGP